jgi:hypothetical protein
MNKIKQSKFEVFIKDGEIFLDDLPKNWKLVRERDNLTKFSTGITWIQWNKSGGFKEKHDEIEVGRSLLMSPFNHFFTWQTTEVTEIVVNDDDYIQFRTKNSNYELFKLKN